LKNFEKNGENIVLGVNFCKGLAHGFGTKCTSKTQVWNKMSHGFRLLY